MDIEDRPGTPKAFFDYVYPSREEEKEQEEATLELILLSSQKGGVGKSTTST